MKAQILCFGLLLVLSSNAMFLDNHEFRGKRRQALQQSCEREAEDFLHHRDMKTDNDISSSEESEASDDMQESGLCETCEQSMHRAISENTYWCWSCGFTHSLCDGIWCSEREEERSMYYSSESASDNEKSEVTYWCWPCDEKHALGALWCNGIWCSDCEEFRHDVCDCHNQERSSDWSDSEGSYDDIAVCYRKPSIVESTEQNTELFELTPKQRGIKNRTKKIIYRRRAHAINQQEKHGTTNKHTPRIVEFKRAKNLIKMFSE